LILLVFVFFAWVRPVQAEQKTIEIPKGAKIQKLGPGHFKFVLPNDRIIELKGMNPGTSKAETIELIDPDPPHKPVSGKQVTLRFKRLTGKEAIKLAEHDYVRIDDDIAWLPLSITFQVMGLVFPESLAQSKSPTQPPPPTAPLTPQTSREPSVIRPSLPIRIDSIRAEPELIKEGQRSVRLIIEGMRIVAGDELRSAAITLLVNGKRTRTGFISIRGTEGRFFKDFLIDWPFVPGVYQVQVEHGSQSYISPEFQTETWYRFRR